MNKMDYDKSELRHTPIILSIIITIIFVFILTIGLLIYFQGSLKLQEETNEQIKSTSFDLSQLKEWEKRYLNSTDDGKINIHDAIYITTIRYNN